MKQQTSLVKVVVLSLFVMILQACEENNNNEKPDNQSPTCSITKPSSGEEITLGTQIIITADAKDEDSNIKEVQFFINDSLIAISRVAPYGCEWRTALSSEGKNTIKAVAIDKEDAKAEDEIDITLKSMDTMTDLEWVEVEGGSYEMGCKKEQSDCFEYETPVHTVAVNSFEMTKYEITNAQFVEFLNDIECNSDGTYNDMEYGNVEYLEMDNGYREIYFNDGEFVVENGQENYPVFLVTWFGAKAFAQWAGGRLPTEAEWEFAARGGNLSNGYLYSGSANLDEVAWHQNNSYNHTHRVGLKKANELGLYDMTGNASEWCNDWFGDEYYENSPENNPQGPSTGDYRVIRGSSYDCLNYCRISIRSFNGPQHSAMRLGFRIVR